MEIQRPPIIDVLYLVQKKYVILVLTGVFFALGLTYAILAQPIYSAKVEIFPKDPYMNASKPSFLGGLGGLGLNPAQNSNISQMQIILKGEELAETVIRKRNLLPQLYPEKWDRDKNAWKKDDMPTIREGVEKLQGMITVTSQPKYMLLEVEVRSNKAELSFAILEAYLHFLNENVRQGVLLNLEANRIFLETQLTQLTDPMLRQRVQDLIALQIENALFLGATAFDLPENPRQPWDPDGPKRVRIALLSLFFGFGLSCFLVLVIRKLRQVAESFRGEINTSSLQDVP